MVNKLQNEIASKVLNGRDIPECFGQPFINKPVK